MKHLVFALALLTSTTVNSAQLIINSNGILNGANGVDVAGILYNVEFFDSMLSLSTSNPFVSFDYPTAQLAVQSLLDQVLIDSPLGRFDSLTYLTTGCTHSDVCRIILPIKNPEIYQDSPSTAYINFTQALNLSPDYEQYVTNEGYRQVFSLEGNNTSLDTQLTTSRWSLVSAVPAPSAIWLFLSGLGLLPVIRKRNS